VREAGRTKTSALGGHAPQEKKEMEQKKAEKEGGSLELKLLETKKGALMSQGASGIRQGKDIVKKMETRFWLHENEQHGGSERKCRCRQRDSAGGAPRKHWV